MENTYLLVCVLLAHHVNATSIRLIGGVDKYEGRVEVYHNGWGTVCDDGFGIEDAAVVCRMLNFGYTFPKPYSNAHFGEGSGTILLDNLGCNSLETDISQCSFSGNTWGKHNCHHNEDVGVRCEPLNIRLVGGRSSLEGRVEVKPHGGNWGTVCQNSISVTDAEIVCNILDHPSRYAHIQPAGFYPVGRGPMYNTNLTCFASDRTCTYHPISNSSLSSCLHTKEIGIKCAVDITTNLRLIGGETPFDGIVEVKHNGQWGSVCGNVSRIQDAKAICSNLGLQSDSARILNSTNYLRENRPVLISNLHCNGNESDIKQCNVHYEKDVCSHDSIFAVSCGHTNLRLVNGAGSWEGRLEVQHKGQWGTICSDNFDVQDARIVCRTLGFHDSLIDPEVLHNSYFGEGSGTILLDHVNCNDTSLDITSCMTKSWGVHNCSHSNDVGVRCKTRNIRLSDGSHSMEGRVEIYMNGHWTTVCDTNWDDMDATFVCRQFVDYPLDKYVIGKAYRGSYFGAGRGLIGMTNVNCFGNESSILHCSHESPYESNCEHSNDAGVACYVNETAQIINTNSNDSSTGTIQITLNGSEYTICSNQWDEHDAIVFCRSLGYWSNSPLAYIDSWFGAGNGISIDLGLNCSGYEADISFCPHERQWGKQACSHSNDAGVKCITTPLGRNNVRIVDGDRTGKGRLEVFYNKQWRSFCIDDGWTDENTESVCRMLKYSATNLSYFPFPQHTSPILPLTLRCIGNETDIGHCYGHLNRTSSGTCSSVVGVDCTGGIQVDVVNSPNILNGPLEAIGRQHGDTLWKYINGDSISGPAMRVLCSSLGYSDTHPIKVDNFASYPTLKPVGGSTFHNAICDGWENHIGQCAYDHDGSGGPVLALKCFNCSKKLTSSNGTSFSVNFPLNYENNLDCLTVVKPTIQGKYVLILKNLQLKGDGDFLEIRDGRHGKQLGLFSSSGPLPVMVGNEFWIRFKTNSNGVDKGYSLIWKPLVLEDTMTVQCGPSNWNIMINMTLLRALYPEVQVSDIYMHNINCKGRVFDDALVFNQSYTECSTAKQSSISQIMYSNQLIYPKKSSSWSPIIHGYKWRVDVQCKLDSQETVTQHYKPTDPTTMVATVTPHHIGNSGHFQINLSFYKDAGFYEEIKGNPIIAHLGNNVYVKASVNTDDPGLRMRLDTCVTTPGLNADRKYTYSLIKNGCSVDPDTKILAQGTHETRFMFNVFEFPINHNDVYVSCNATFCDTSDTSSSCLQICHSGRALNRRAYLNADFYKTVNVYSGRFEE